MRFQPKSACLALLLSIAFVDISHSQTTEFFPINKYIKQNKSQIDELLGKPENCEKTKYGPKCYYDRGAVEIIFIGGKADWFTLNMKAIPFLPSSISSLGLPIKIATTENNYVIRWDNVYQDIMSISAFPGESATISYFYIKVETP